MCCEYENEYESVNKECSETQMHIEDKKRYRTIAKQTTGEGGKYWNHGSIPGKKGGTTDPPFSGLSKNICICAELPTFTAYISYQPCMMWGISSPMRSN